MGARKLIVWMVLLGLNLALERIETSQLIIRGTDLTFPSLRRIKTVNTSEKLERIPTNPLLKPRSNAVIEVNGKKVQWEKLVYNPAAIRINGITYLLYRALGYDGISRIGLAWSKDGIHEEGRLDFPVFGPEEKYEQPQTQTIKRRKTAQLNKYGTIREVGGTEDPRLTMIGDYLYMTYTAYGEIPQIAVARIKIKDFLSAVKGEKSYQEWKKSWERLGIIRTGEDKDAIIFPESSSEGLLLIHRIFPDMQILHVTDKMRIKGTDDIGDVFMKPRAGMWDSEKIGAGAPPLKTEYGWLQIYHGVGTWKGRRAYRLGVVLTDLNDPSKIIYRSPEPILEPREDYEKNGWVDNVVFTCGVVPEYKDSNTVLSKDDTILVYYGAGDQVIAVARAKISDLIPKNIIIEKSP